MTEILLQFKITIFSFEYIVHLNIKSNVFLWSLLRICNQWALYHPVASREMRSYQVLYQRLHGVFSGQRSKRCNYSLHERTTHTGVWRTNTQITNKKHSVQPCPLVENYEDKNPLMIPPFYSPKGWKVFKLRNGSSIYWCHRSCWIGPVVFSFFHEHR